jgi:hypothetical protein
VSSPVVRFTPARRYLVMAIAAAAGAALSVWSALRWNPAWLLDAAPWIPRDLGSAFGPALSPSWFSPSWIAAVLFAIPAVALFLLAFRPAIEIHETHLSIGRRQIPWAEIRRLDQTGWNVPLVVHLTLDGERRVLLIHPGDFDSSASLLRHLRRHSRAALLDGVPYRQFWGEPPSAAPPQIAPPRYPLLRPDDEEEVERMFQRLKSVGHLERRDADEE